MCMFSTLADKKVGIFYVIFKVRRDSNAVTSLCQGIVEYIYNFGKTTPPSALTIPYKKASMLISSVLTGYLSSYFSNTVGCKIPKAPMTWSLPAIRRWMDAA